MSRDNKFKLIEFAQCTSLGTFSTTILDEFGFKDNDIIYELIDEGIIKSTPWRNIYGQPIFQLINHVKPFIMNPHLEQFVILDGFIYTMENLCDRLHLSYKECSIFLKNLEDQGLIYVEDIDGYLYIHKHSYLWNVLVDYIQQTCIIKEV